MSTFIDLLPHFITLLACLYIPSFSWPLDSAFARGDSCINISWTPDSANTDQSWYIRWGTQCTGADSVYLHSDFIPGRTYNGVAYSYGGEDPWDLFAARIDSGYRAGSHLCHYREYGDPSDTITGTDCSGYLCFIWNVPRMSTGGLLQSSLFTHIDKADLRAGDALVRGGYHCVFVAEADDPSELVIWEASSSVFGCRERITDITNSYWGPYTALRYPEITKINYNEIDGLKTTAQHVPIKVLPNGTMCLSLMYCNRMVIKVHTALGQLVEMISVPAHAKEILLNKKKYYGNGIYVISLLVGNDLLVTKIIVLCL